MGSNIFFILLFKLQHRPETQVVVPELRREAATVGGTAARRRGVPAPPPKHPARSACFKWVCFCFHALTSTQAESPGRRARTPAGGRSGTAVRRHAVPAPAPKHSVRASFGSNWICFNLFLSHAFFNFKTGRKPMRLCRYSNAMPLRRADRQDAAVLYQLPPRSTQREPSVLTGSVFAFMF